MVSISGFPSFPLPGFGEFSGFVEEADYPCVLRAYWNSDDVKEWHTVPGDIARIAGASTAIARQFSRAATYGTEPKAGSYFRKTRIDDADYVLLELAINVPTYSPPALHFTFMGVGPVCLYDTQRDKLLEALSLFGAAARQVQRVSPGGGDSHGLARSGPGNGSPLSGWHQMFNRQFP